MQLVTTYNSGAILDKYSVWNKYLTPSNTLSLQKNRRVGFLSAISPVEYINQGIIYISTSVLGTLSTLINDTLCKQLL